MPRTLITKAGRRIQGLDELNDKIAEIIDRATSKEVKKIWMSGALELRDAAREFAPIAPGPITHYERGQAPRTIQPGALRAAIFAAYGDDAKPNVLVGVNHRMAPHSKWIEFGNSRIPPQPYMRPALTLTRGAITEKIAEGYRQLLIDNGSISEPTSPGGPVMMPTVTQARINRVRSAARYKAGF